MMQKLWLKKLELNYSKDIFDIVQYGSSTIIGKIPNDIDIVVIYKKIPLKDQLNQSQDIKKQLSKLTELKIDIKSYDLYSFFQPSNFSKHGILIYGKSLISKKEFALNFNLVPRIQIEYVLKKLEKKDKVRFHYMLKGKKNESGLLNKYGGKLLSPGLIEIYPENEKIFEDAIKEFKIVYNKNKILKEQ